MSRLVILWGENRKYTRYLVRVGIGDRWYEVMNLADPRFWQEWWSGFYGTRWWHLRRSIRHLVRPVERSIYIEVGE